MDEYPAQFSPRPGVTLTLDPTRLVLGFGETPTAALAAAGVAELGLVPEASLQGAAADSDQGEAINDSDVRVWMRSADAQAISADVSDQARGVYGDNLAWVGPVYQTEGDDSPRSRLCPLPNVLLLRPSQAALEGDTDLTEQLSEYGLTKVPEKSEYLGEYDYYVLEDPFAASSFDVYQQLLDSELVQELRFESMPMIVPTATSPNDPLYAQQWDMVQIEAGGSGETGWDIAQGTGIVICVLDEGCDLTHPDLQFSTPGINLGTMLPDGSPTGNHGTACAGIAAASFNNSEGVAGVAGEAQVMPLAFNAWTDVEVAAGINYAAGNGAHVISMSFGWDPWDHAIIDPAIQNAYNAGLVMCVATHNHNGSITYPATNPLVIACGASDEIDNRKSPTSPDGENWGSNFGPAISVVAPGVHIPTTDRQGGAGYNTNGGAAGNYHLTFNGTSSATPHVAGLAALILSLSHTLTNDQVREIIERTAEKVGTVAYSDTAGHPNGTWNQEMGYGRINVLKALNYAKGLSNMNSMKICSGKTEEGNTDWIPYGSSGNALYVDVDTSACGFDTTPIYIINMHGNSWNWVATGGSSAYNRTPTGFRVYVRLIDKNAITPAFANQRKWHIEWIATSE